MTLKKLAFLTLCSSLLSCGEQDRKATDQQGAVNFSSTGALFSPRLSKGRCIAADSSKAPQIPTSVRTDPDAFSGILSSLAVKGIDVLFSAVTNAIKEAAEEKDQTYTAALSTSISTPGIGRERFPLCLHLIVGHFFALGPRIDPETVTKLQTDVLSSSSKSPAASSLIKSYQFSNELVREGHYLASDPALFAEFYIRPAVVGGKTYISMAPTIIRYASVLGTKRLGSAIGKRDLVFNLQIGRYDAKKDPTNLANFQFSIEDLTAGNTVLFFPNQPFESKWQEFEFTTTNIASLFEFSVTETRNASEFLSKFAEILEDSQTEITTPIKEAVDPSLALERRTQERTKQNEVFRKYADAVASVRQAITQYESATPPQRAERAAAVYLAMEDLDIIIAGNPSASLKSPFSQEDKERFRLESQQ